MNEQLIDISGERPVGGIEAGDSIVCMVPNQPQYSGEVTATDGGEVQFWCPKYSMLLWIPARFCRVIRP